MICLVSYLFHSLEVHEAKFVDVLRLALEDFSSEIVEQTWEVGWDLEILDVLACNFFIQILKIYIHNLFFLDVSSFQSLHDLIE